MNSAFRAMWLVPRSRDIKWHSSHKPVSPEQRIINASQLFSGSRDHGFCVSYTGFVMFVLHQDVVWKVFHFAWNPKGLVRYKSVFSCFLVLYCRHIFAWGTFVYDWMSDNCFLLYWFLLFTESQDESQLTTSLDSLTVSNPGRSNHVDGPLSAFVTVNQWHSALMFFTTNFYF